MDFSSHFFSTDSRAPPGPSPAFLREEGGLAGGTGSLREEGLLAGGTGSLREEGWLAASLQALVEADWLRLPKALTLLEGPGEAKVKTTNMALCLGLILG